jgi:hypothetical protein
MHTRDLVELASLVAVHSPALIHGPLPVPQSAVEEVWAATRCRLDRWTRLLRRLANAGGQLPRPATLAWPRTRPVLEEILAAELLTRIWTATSVACDTARGDDELGPVARSLMAGHLEARCRLLQLVADARAIETAEAVALNHLRRRTERWCDMLLAHLAPHIDIAEFAFLPQRAADFADDLARDAVNEQQQLTCQLILASLRAAFHTGLADHSPNSDLNRRIGAGILACFGELLSDAAPLVKPLWLARMTAVADDAQGMIDELVAFDAQS